MGFGFSNVCERLHFHFSLSCIGEGNGNPLQCSCLESPRDGGAWWEAVYGVAQSRTRLKRLSSSSSSALQWLRRGLSGKESICNAGDTGVAGSIPRWRRSPGGENGNPLQYSCLENPVDRGAWRATVHRVAKSQMRLSTCPPKPPSSPCGGHMACPPVTLLCQGTQEQTVVIVAETWSCGTCWSQAPRSWAMLTSQVESRRCVGSTAVPAVDEKYQPFINHTWMPRASSELRSEKPSGPGSPCSPWFNGLQMSSYKIKGGKRKEIWPAGPVGSREGPSPWGHSRGRSLACPGLAGVLGCLPGG